MGRELFLTEDGKWQCIQCGACCKLIGPLVQRNLMHRGYDRGDGVCKKLNRDNTCAIYEGRPSLCRVSKHVFNQNDLAEACWRLYEKVNNGGDETRERKED